MKMRTKVVDIKAMVRHLNSGWLNDTDQELFDLLITWASKGYRKVNIDEIADVLGWHKNKVKYRLNKLRDRGVLTCSTE
jgi:predicted ArsR family transcriptional regulator